MTDAPNVDLSALVKPVEAIAREAGCRILDVYAGSFSVVEKADQSPVTAADLAAHDCILHGLAELTPDIPVLSEEAPDVSFAERSRWEWLWLVDPLDGTREFIKRNDQFTVNIALVHRHEAVLGLVLRPVGGLCYHAWRGGGARAGPPRPGTSAPGSPARARPARAQSCCWPQARAPETPQGGRRPRWD
jgi:3'(2'), 5'-bisphosphate nucleotidase